MCDHNKKSEAALAAKEKEYKDYCDYRKELFNHEKENETELLKQYLIFATAFFGLSFGLMNKVIPLEKASCYGLLLGAWFAMLFTVIFVFLSMFTTVKSAQSLLKIYDSYMKATKHYLAYARNARKKEDYIAGKLKVCKRSTSTKIIICLNRMACILFTLSLILLFLFIAVNLDNLRNKEPKTQVKIETSYSLNASYYCGEDTDNA